MNSSKGTRGEGVIIGAFQALVPGSSPGACIRFFERGFLVTIASEFFRVDIVKEFFLWKRESP